MVRNDNSSAISGDDNYHRESLCNTQSVFQNTDYPIVRRHTEKFNQSTPFHRPLSLSLSLSFSPRTVQNFNHENHKNPFRGTYTLRSTSSASAPALMKRNFLSRGFSSCDILLYERSGGREREREKGRKRRIRRNDTYIAPTYRASLLLSRYRVL